MVINLIKSCWSGQNINKTCFDLKKINGNILILKKYLKHVILNDLGWTKLSVGPSFITMF
jgi:hypothetical protein